jgi:hypothetical protein
LLSAASVRAAIGLASRTALAAARIDQRLDHALEMASTGFG